MSSSELRYLITANELAEQTENVKQTDVAKDRKIVLTDRGREVLNEYMTIIRFMSAHLSLHCGTTENQAYEDALNAACAFSDATRNGVANYIKSGMADAHHAPIDKDKEQINDR